MDSRILFSSASETTRALSTATTKPLIGWGNIEPTIGPDPMPTISLLLEIQAFKSMTTIRHFLTMCRTHGNPRTETLGRELPLTPGAAPIQAELSLFYATAL